MKHKLIPKRIGALLLCLTLLAGLLPTAAWAADADKAIMLGTSGIAGYDSAAGYDYIYFGRWTAQEDTYTTSGPIKWRVLDNQTNTGETGLFLLSDVLLGTGGLGGVYFDNSGSDSNVWQKSTAQTWCKNFYSNNFSSKEQNAVLETTKSDTKFTSSTYGKSFAASENILNGDKVFFLSAEEAENSEYGFTDENSRIANYGNNARNWWLRSPSASYTFSAGLVNGFGGVDNFTVSFGLAARPAFNLDLNSVLFTSAAEGGKTDSAVDSSLTAVKDYAGNEWKLTLLDSNRSSFTALATETSATTQAENYSGWTVEVTYSGAQTGSNEYVSAMLVDGSGSVLYYGRVAQPGEATGTATITIPSGLTAGNYTLKVFSEQCNGDKITDYASAFEDIDLHVHGWSDTWNSDDTHHWHICTAADCPVSDNSQKDGYAEHVYDRQVATDSYLASPATCTQAATYYKSCSCGAKGTETFTSGNPTGHTPGADWMHDNGNTHWNECASCGIKLNEAAHVYDDGQDDTCNACEYVRTTYTLTINLNNGSGSSTGGKYAEGTVVNIDAGTRTNYRFTSWDSSNGGTFADPSSASTTFTMPAADTTITANWQYNPPYIPPVKTPSEQAIDKIEDAVDGVTVKITLSTGQTRLDKEVFEALAGRDVTLEISVPGGVSWTVNGQDIPKTANLTDLNLGVDLGTSGISVDVINAVTGEYGSVQITLAHDGEFGFALTLTAPLGRGNAGLWANLYHYDEARERLTFETSARIAADGSAALRMTHASQYAIVIDDRSHAMTFADVAEGAWYYDAVSYVYANGLMDGVSASEFAPDTTLTRAMLVTILWRMEGEPVVNYLMPFTDVDGGAWYAEAVRWAASEGIVTGVSDTSFAPNAEITREQLAAILHRYADEPATAANLAGYADGASVSAYAVDAMSWCVEHDIITGTTATTLEPQGTATRAQAAAMLMRFADR